MKESILKDADLDNLLDELIKDATPTPGNKDKVSSTVAQRIAKAELIQNDRKSTDLGQGTKTHSTPKKTSNIYDQNKNGQVLDELLEMLDDIGVGGPTPTSSSAKVQKSEAAGKSATKEKCTILRLSNSLDHLGVSNALVSNGCSNIRCTACDFTIVHFKDSVWQSTCDYLFFRNNMPNAQKLAQKLSYSKGFMAYCCQCSWVSVSKDIPMSEHKEASKFKWVCAGHQPE